MIETRSARRHELVAWRADTPQTREQGLMFVREIGAEQAMIFVYDPPANVSMWMKNTLLPLDMLFVSGRRLRREASSTMPSPDRSPIISAGALVALVVELQGGIGGGARHRRRATASCGHGPTGPHDQRPCLSR